MGSTERRAREKEEMRAQITRAAMKLFLTEGFEKTSIRRIAEAIEYTPGAIYSYFKDKDEILYTLHDEGMERLFAALGPASEVDDPREALEACCRRYLDFALKNPEYYDLMFIMDATGNKIQEKGDWLGGIQNYDVLRRCVYRGMKSGALPAGNPEAAAFALWSFVHGMVALHIRHRCPMIPEEALPGLIEGAADWLIATLSAAAAHAPSAKVTLPEFVPMAGLTQDGITHLRAFQGGACAACAPEDAPKAKAAPKPTPPRKKAAPRRPRGA